MKRMVTLAAAGIAAAFLLFAPYLVNAFYVRVLTEILVFGLLAVSINMLVGYTGLATLGQAGIFGVSAYGIAYLSVRAGLPIAVVIPLALLAAITASAVFGAMATRTSGIYFLMITLAQGMIVWGLAFRWYDVTGAENGIAGVARPPLLAPYWIFYYVVLAIVALMVLLVHRFVRSPFGLTLKGIREGEARMAALGYHVSLHKFLGFVAAGMVAGVAGVLYAYHNNFVSPAAVEFARSAEGILMVILGGAGTLFGPLVGAAIIVFTRHQVSLFTDRWLMILGAIFVVTILVAPDGLVSGVRRVFALVFPTRPEPPPAAAPGAADQAITGEPVEAADREEAPTSMTGVAGKEEAE